MITMNQICIGILFLGSLGTGVAWAQEAASAFSANCANCHGPDGSGNTVIGRALKLHDLRSPATQKLSQDELIAIISKGTAGGKMPGFQKKLGSQTIAALAAYLREIEPHPAPPVSSAKPANSETTGIKDVFAANCANCHGATGDGNTVIGRAMKIHDLRAEAQALSFEEITEIIAHGTDHGRMAGFQKKLGTETVEQLAGYVRVLAGQPPAAATKTAPKEAPTPVTPASGAATSKSEAAPAVVPPETQAPPDTRQEKGPANAVTAVNSASRPTGPKIKRSSGLIDLNSADKQTLMTLPGLTAADADQIIAGRPYKSTLQFKVRNIITPEKYAKIAARVVTKQSRHTAKPAPE